MARSKGTAIFAVNFEPTGQSPLDARLVVGLVSDLTNAATYEDNNIYNGMVVAVLEDNSLYMLTNMSEVTNSASWKRLDSGSSSGDIGDLQQDIQEINQQITDIIGDEGDTSADNSLAGVKKYAEEAAEQAKSEAIESATETAAQDATQKANTAEQNAKDYTDDGIGTLKSTIDSYTVNGHAISSNPVLTKSDVGLGNVTNEAQIPLTQKGAASGVAPLNEDGKIPAQYLDGHQARVQGIDAVTTSSSLPGSPEEGYMVWCTDDKKFRDYVDGEWQIVEPAEDVIYNFRNSDATGSTSRTNILYRWDGENLTEISASIAIGETTGTAYDGAKGAANRNAITSLPATIITALGSITRDGTQITIPVTVATKSGLNYGSAAAGTSIVLPVASSTQAGLMSAADKQKFDTLVGDGGEGSIKDQIDAVKTTIDAYTVNGKAIKSNPVLGGADIVLTGYTIASNASAVAAGDTVNVAIGKLQKQISDNNSSATNDLQTVKDSLGFTDGSYEPTADELNGMNVTEAIDHLSDKTASVPNYYTTNATSGNSIQITAANHKCGTTPLVQTYLGTEIVDTAVTVASNGDVTVSWNGSGVTSGTPLKVVIVGK